MSTTTEQIKTPTEENPKDAPKKNSGNSSILLLGLIGVGVLVAVFFF